MLEQIFEVVSNPLIIVARSASIRRSASPASKTGMSTWRAPVAGEVIAVNESLPDNLEKLSNDPYGEGWIARIKISDESGLKNLMDHAAYQKQCSEEAH